MVGLRVGDKHRKMEKEKKERKKERNSGSLHRVKKVVTQIQAPRRKN